MENEDAIRRAEAGMPFLDLETSLRSKRTLGRMLGFHGPGNLRGRQIADGFVRLVEKTILEYQLSREKLIVFLRNGFVDDYYRAQDHFESSLQSLHRAMLYLERLRHMGFRRADGTPFIPRPRDLEVLRDEVKARVRNFRDAAEHLDEDIVQSRVPENAEVGIHLGWERASLGGIVILYVDFVRWTHQLHSFAGLLSRVLIKVDAAPPCEENESDLPRKTPVSP